MTKSNAAWLKTGFGDQPAKPMPARGFPAAT
jgi:hypothetical protein